MYTVSARPLNGLGALPALLVTAIVTMVDYKFTDAQIKNQLAAQYDEMQRLGEAEITELAVLLGRRTAKPEWEWFNLLRSARDMALFRNGEPANGTPGSGERQPEDKSIKWIAAGVGVLILLLALRR